MAPTWKRTRKGGLNTAADGRAVDEAAIVSLLQKRSAAKASKDFAAADAAAALLQAQGVCYLDGKCEWYTKSVEGGSDVKRPRAAKSDAPRAATKRKAEEVAVDEEDDVSSSEDEGDAEEDRLDDAFVEKMIKQVAKAPAATAAAATPAAAAKAAIAKAAAEKPAAKPPVATAMTDDAPAAAPKKAAAAAPKAAAKNPKKKSKKK
ncbi:hypothetical protein M885DRAFT_514703 [Pelagophyceae sp. CCMP2097]|nr:hypothetical protein M885DRAFT_514703 [Pelagophyceae sp. CCMP2097]